MPSAAECHVAGVADAEPAVAQRAERGADYLKIVIDLPGFDLETVAALVSAAHRRSLRVVAHASRLDAVMMAAAAGVDVLTHVPMDRPLPASTAAELADRGAVLVPTLAMMKAIADRFSAAGHPGPSYECARDSVAAAHAAGLPILAGTDANATPAAPASPPFGTSLHDELGLLVDAGLSPVESLAAGTSAPVGYFGLVDRGRIAPGLRADLVVLDADPTADITAIGSIKEVWIAGERVGGRT
jgi:imidazolonepropionase-like amidohydrolase